MNYRHKKKKNQNSAETHNEGSDHDVLVKEKREARKKKPLYDGHHGHRLPLCSDQHVPPHLRTLYVFTGYRGYERKIHEDEEDERSLEDLDYDEIYYPFTWCVRSLCTVHNETINIWTHLVPGLLYFYFGIDGMVDVLTNHQFEIAKLIAFITRNELPPESRPSFDVRQDFGFTLVSALYLLACSAAFLGSAIFHWLNPVSRKYHFRLRVVDFTGISFLVIGSQWPLLYGTFYCDLLQHQDILHTPFFYFATFLLAMGLFGVVFPFFPMFHSLRFRALRISVFVLMSLSPLLILGVALSLHIRWTDISYLFLSLLGTYAGYVLGLFFYSARFPESKKPGKFDIWLNSHQIWHCITVYTSYCWYNQFQKYMEWRLNTTCLLQ